MFPRRLQKSFQVLALGVACARLGIGIVVFVSPVPSTTRPLIFLGVAPMLIFFFMVLQKHQRWEQSIAAAASAEERKTILNVKFQHQRPSDLNGFN